MREACLFLQESTIHGYGLFSLRVFQPSTIIMALSCEHTIGINEFIRNVHKEKTRHAHEYISCSMYEQDQFVDKENKEVKFVDLVAARSPILHLNSANSVEDVNVVVVPGIGFAFSPILVLKAVRFIDIGRELLDGYMLSDDYLSAFVV